MRYPSVGIDSLAQPRYLRIPIQVPVQKVTASGGIILDNPDPYILIEGSPTLIHYYLTNYRNL